MAKKTKKYSFCETFTYGPKGGGRTANFDIEFTEEEADILREFLRKNGDCDYAYLEPEHSDLFWKINDAANDAVLLEINKRRRKKLDFDDVDWMGLRFDFYWPEELLGGD